VSEDRAEMFDESDEPGPVPVPEPRRAWRPIGPLDHPWWRRDRPKVDRLDVKFSGWAIRGMMF
jgi:hypothetical protein